jgi:hypothetical protein
LTRCCLFYRWRRGKEEEEGTAKKHVKRPYLATECDNLGEAERWRQQVGIFQFLRGQRGAVLWIRIQHFK